MSSPVILWFRHDLRLEDNLALIEASRSDAPVIPIYIECLGEEEPWSPGRASRWWLHYSLKSLSASLEKLGNRLYILQGKALQTLEQLIEETGANSVFWGRRYEPAIIERDSNIKKTLIDKGINVKSFKNNLLFEPWEVETNSGTPYKVFTPFWRSCLSKNEPPPPMSAPETLLPYKPGVKSLELKNLALLPKIDWASGMKDFWQPGEVGAGERLEQFLNSSGLGNYQEGRNIPSQSGVSYLSPHLHFGEISPRQVWHGVKDYSSSTRIKKEESSIKHYLAEIGWREFAHHVLYHFPHTTDSPLREEFARFPWSEKEDVYKAWQKGMTGYPIVDAGMRELWHTGWMHNRVRMIVASFLTKDLFVSWQDGARWFWDTLVDADLASNTLGWQWTSGCGADAAPYFRIFNPILQSKKFDPDGTYIKEWVPELKNLSPAKIHAPWTLSESDLEKAGIVLGETYPMPLVDHSEARQKALALYNDIKPAKVVS